MQRQSLGSPGRERLSLSSLNDAESSSSSTSSSAVADATSAAAADDKIKPGKHPRSGAERYIHLIPVLIFLVFLVLYLSSHDPSPQDMAHFPRFKHSEQFIENSIDEIGSNKVLTRSAAFAIRSLRNLQEETSNTRSFSTHRKLGFF